MELPRRELYDIAAAIADDISGGGRSVVIGVVIATYEERSALRYDEHYHAYLDDSTSAKGKIICAGGYLFVPNMAREFREHWKPFLDSKGLKYFHAKDCFRRPDAEELFSTLAVLTKRTAMHGHVQFRNPKDLLSLDKRNREYVGSLYSMTTLTCMKSMAEEVRDQNKSIVYFIEDGNEYAGELRCFLNQIKANPTLVKLFAMAGADTYKKEDVIQLQAADLFAWSFSRSHWRERWEKSIIDLVQDKAVRHLMGQHDPALYSMFNMFYGLRSNRTTFDYDKHNRERKSR